MKKLEWHFSRKALAEQVLGMFDSGLSSALVFFAPRRMGKTEFLLKDISPLAEKKDWKVCYHSFLDISKDAEVEFTKSLQHLQDLQENSFLSKSKNITKRIKTLSGGVVGFQGSVEMNNSQAEKIDFREMLTTISKQHKLILLMDEIQALTKNNEANLPFITALRTILDTNKDQISVIFTGSSREGLKKMFSAKEAPFFHFGQNLSFPEFGQEFTKHLAKQYSVITNKNLDENELWKAFEEFGKMPQLIRALVERLVLQPALTIHQAKVELLDELAQDRSFENNWNNFTVLEQLVLGEIAAKNQKLYSIETRHQFALKLGLQDIPVSSIQSVLRKLNKNSVIGRSMEHGEYFVDDPNFQDWILQA